MSSAGPGGETEHIGIPRILHPSYCIPPTQGKSTCPRGRTLGPRVEKKGGGGGLDRSASLQGARFSSSTLVYKYVACNVRTMWCNVIVLIFIFNVRVFKMTFNCVKCYDFSYYISLEYYLDLHCLSRSRSRRALCSTFYLINANEISMNSTFMN